MMLLSVKNCRRNPRSFPFRLFTKLLKCSKLLFSVTDNKLMIFLELGFFALLVHVKIRELSHAYYRPINFLILQADFSIKAVDVLDRQSLDNTNLFFNHSKRQSSYSIAFWTIATIILNQQSIISAIPNDLFNQQSIISITAIDIFDHKSINSTIAINFLITNCELKPRFTDMASHTAGWSLRGNWPLDYSLFLSTSSDVISEI